MGKIRKWKEREKERNLGQIKFIIHVDSHSHTNEYLENKSIWIKYKSIFSHLGENFFNTFSSCAVALLPQASLRSSNKIGLWAVSTIRDKRLIACKTFMSSGYWRDPTLAPQSTSISTVFHMTMIIIIDRFCVNNLDFAKRIKITRRL